MSFFGKERVGKTFIIDYYCKQYPRYTQKGVISIRNRLEAAEITYIPVLYVRMPCPANLGGLTGKIFEALGDPFSHHKHHIVEQTKAIRGLLKRCGVQLLIFDEVQHFVDRDKKKLLIESSDWLKNLIDETEIPTILVGTREAEKIFMNDQLNGRFFLRQELEPFNCHDIVGELSFRKILQNIDNGLPLREPSNLSENGMWERLFLASNGHIPYLMQLIKKSVYYALENNLNSISMELFQEIYLRYIFKLGICEGNPFTPDFKLDSAMEVHEKQQKAFYKSDRIL